MATGDEQAAVARVMGPLRSPCVVELGAHLGEDEGWIRSVCCEQAHYVMVEPDALNVQHILDHGGCSRTRRVILGAVAATDGPVTFYGSTTKDGVRGSGSIRKPTLHCEIFPDVLFPKDRQTVVPGYSLNSLFEKEWLTRIDLLWVDVQGAERDMISGGMSALTHTRYLFIETEPSRLYDGMATKDELLALLPSGRWHLIEDFGYNCLLENEQFWDRGPR